MTERPQPRSSHDLPERGARRRGETPASRQGHIPGERPDQVPDDCTRRAGLPSGAGRDDDVSGANAAERRSGRQPPRPKSDVHEGPALAGVTTDQLAPAKERAARHDARAGVTRGRRHIPAPGAANLRANRDERLHLAHGTIFASPTRVDQGRKATHLLTDEQPAEIGPTATPELR